MGKFIDLTGNTFNRLTVLKRVENDKNGNVQWLCKCNCKDENEIIIRTSYLKSGHTKSCGCLQKEKIQNIGNNNKKYNTYDLTGEYGIGYTDKGEEFWFDLEDYDKIKDYCWSKNSKGYIIAYYNIQINIQMHRLVMNCPNNMQIDHIYHNKFDNRKEFLRVATNSQNQMNINIQSNNTSGIIGVYWDKKCEKWSALVIKNKIRIYLGSFINKDDAIKARLEAEVKYFGEFAPQQHLYEKYGIKDVK